MLVARPAEIEHDPGLHRAPAQRCAGFVFPGKKRLVGSAVQPQFRIVPVKVDHGLVGVPGLPFGIAVPQGIGGPYLSHQVWNRLAGITDNAGDLCSEYGISYAVQVGGFVQVWGGPVHLFIGYNTEKEAHG